MAESAEEAQKKKRRRRLATGLLLGGAAVGLPALLSRWRAHREPPLAAPTWGLPQRIRWRGAEVLYQQLGQGPPLLLVHGPGPGHDGREWDRVARPLAEQHLVLVPDLPGWGRSEALRPVPSGALYADFLIDFFRSEVGTGGALVASGLAGAWAVGAAVELGSELGALALVGPTGLHRSADRRDPAGWLLRSLMGAPVLGASGVSLFTTRTAVERYLRQEVFAAPDRVDAARVDHHLASGRQPAAQRSLAAYYAGRLDYPVEGLLGRLASPVWMAWGRDAKSPPVERADHWLRHFPGARLEVFDRCGALPHLEVPVELVRSLARFLEGTSS